MWEVCFVDWKLIIILSLFFLNHCHSYIAVHFIGMFFITCQLFFENKLMLIFGYRLATVHWGQLSHGATVWPVTEFTFVARISLWLRHTWKSALCVCTHPIIENTLVQHKMAKNLHITLCCQNQESKGTNQRYELHVSTNISVDSASVIVLGLLKDTVEPTDISNSRHLL